MAIRVAVIDDCDLTLVGIRTVLDQDHRFQIIGTGHNLDDLIQIVKVTIPDVILVDEWFHNTDVLWAVQVLFKALPHMRVMVMGTLVEGLMIRDLFAAGVKGYLYKPDKLRDVLIPAIDMVLANRPYLSPTANAEFLVAMQSPMRDWQLDDEARAILRLLSKGLHISDIARELNMKRRHVYWVRQKLRQRFNANTNEHLLMRAAAEGYAFSSE